MMAFFNQPRIPEFVPEAAGVAAKAKEADIAFITIGRSSGEFQDRAIAGDFNLTEQEQALIKTVTEAFHKEGKKNRRNPQHWGCDRDSQLEIHF